jgi:hypothetical protein
MGIVKILPDGVGYDQPREIKKASSEVSNAGFDSRDLLLQFGGKRNGDAHKRTLAIGTAEKE